MNTKLESIIAFSKELEELDQLIEKATTDEERQNLESQKQELFLAREELELKEKIEKEGLTEEHIKQMASIESRKALLKKSEVIDEEKKEKQENKYNLSTKTIVSKKTGETINISYMSVTEKIETIYEHTGEVVSNQDSVLTNYRDSSCLYFIQYLADNKKEEELIEKYGKNWQQEVERLYKQGYDEYMEYYINKKVEAVDNKEQKEEDIKSSEEEKKEEKIQRLSEENDKLTSALNEANSTIVRLTEEKKELGEKVETLSERIVEIQQSHKADMEALKSGIVEISNQTPEIKPEIAEEESYAIR